MDYELWIYRAVSKIGSLKKGTEFLLKELFEGTEWNTLSSGERRELGRQFRNKVARAMIPGVVFIGRAQNNSSKYRKA